MLWGALDRRAMTFAVLVCLGLDGDELSWRLLNCPELGCIAVCLAGLS